MFPFSYIFGLTFNWYFKVNPLLYGIDPSQNYIEEKEKNIYNSYKSVQKNCEVCVSE